MRRLITAAVAVGALVVPSAAGAAPATRNATVRSFDRAGIVTHFFPADGRDGGSEELFGIVGVRGERSRLRR